MIWKEIHGDELYVYFNGEVIYKRWISRGYGVVIDSYRRTWCEPRSQ